MRLLLALVSLAALAAGCSDTRVVNVPLSPAAPGGPGSPSRRAAIEFRATGTALGAIIRYGTSDDGVTQVTTGLPFVIAVSTTQAQSFLSMDVTPTAFAFFNTTPFLSASIVVDGVMFRQAFATDASLSTLSISGTWRSN